MQETNEKAGIVGGMRFDMAKPVHIKEAIAELILHNFGKPCEVRYEVAVACQHDCDADKGLQCWQRFLGQPQLVVKTSVHKQY